jgi:hypothetical protein
LRSQIGSVGGHAQTSMMLNPNNLVADAATMKVIPAADPLPFDAEKFVEMPGTPSHHYFVDVLLTVVQQRHCDVHIGLCPIGTIQDLTPRLESHGYDVYVRHASPTHGEFWLKRRA